MRCFFCGGVAHPATGHQYSATVIACGPCTRDAWTWVKGHTNRPAPKLADGSRPGVSFYEAAAKR